MPTKRKTGSKSGKTSPLNFHSFNNPTVRKFRRSVGLKSMISHAGTVKCLRCSNKFKSHDKRKFRICTRCKKSSDWQAGSSEDDNLLYAAAGNDVEVNVNDINAPPYEGRLTPPNKKNAPRTFLRTKNALEARKNLPKRKEDS